MTEIKELDNGFTYVEVINDVACAEIALQGAHIFHYARIGEEPILWLSDESDFEYTKAIRGGIPICWPSFGMNNSKLPQHGFARTFLWKFISSEDIDTSTTQVIFSLNDSEESRKVWNNKFDLELKVTISKELSIELRTVNRDKKSFKITQALHSYFQISNIKNIMVDGLHNKPYLDALTGVISRQDGTIFFDREIDRVYQEIDQKICLKDIERNIEIKNEGSFSSVIWNPWIEKCKRMSAMSDESYKEFVCIETANAYADFKVLEPGESHSLKTVIS